MIAAKSTTRGRHKRAGKALKGLPGELSPISLPQRAQPMLCTLIAEPFDNADWIFEPKFGGLRVLGRFGGRELILLSRNQQPQSFQPELDPQKFNLKTTFPRLKGQKRDSLAGLLARFDKS